MMLEPEASSCNLFVRCLSIAISPDQMGLHRISFVLLAREFAERCSTVVAYVYVTTLEILGTFCSPELFGNGVTNT